MFPKFIKAGDPKFGDAAGHDPGEVRQVRSDIQREAVESDPMFDPDPKGADLRFLGTFPDPDPNAPLGTMRFNSKLFQRVNHPALEGPDEAANVLAALFKVENYISDTLARTVVGVATAATGVIDRELLRIEKLGRVRAGARGEHRRMLEQPDAFPCFASADRGRALLHERERFAIGHEFVANSPLDIRPDFVHEAQMASAQAKSKRRCANAPGSA